jgi:sodium pump decarboxylase gamma subunit
LGALTPWWMVIILGMGTVMIGLELLVVLCNLLRVLFHKEGQSAPAAAPQPAAVVAQPVGLERQRLLAAVTAAIAEAEGSDAPGFKIVSFVRR